MARNTLSRSLHDLGLSAWFGGTLANAVALNAAAAEAGTDSATGRVANAGWDRWTPVNAAAIGAHLIGSVGQLRANKTRVVGFALNNLLLIADVRFIPDIDLSTWRMVPALAGVAALLYGLIWETR